MSLNNRNKTYARITILQMLYMYDFHGHIHRNILNFKWHDNNNDFSIDFKNYCIDIFTNIVDRVKEIDQHIRDHLNINKITILDRNIIRISIYTLIYIKSIPKNVIINEALNLSHLFTNENSYKFLNGFLDNFLYKIEGANKSNNINKKYKIQSKKTKC